MKLNINKKKEIIEFLKKNKIDFEDFGFKFYIYKFGFIKYNSLQSIEIKKNKLILLDILDNLLFYNIELNKY